LPDNLFSSKASGISLHYGCSVQENEYSHAT
jgi:hypothetical protein